ncbi:MAG: hypothetical protein AAF518_23210, partial [Spirochaetota bacterium]
NDKDDGVRYLLHDFHKDLLAKSYINREKKYVIDPSNSPVIEFLYPVFPYQKNKMLAGRLYYIKDKINTNQELVAKEGEFLTAASSLFRWVKRKFKTKPISGYDGYLVSERSYDWLTKNKGELVLNNA